MGINPENYRWYEVSAIRTDGGKDFIFRTIATSSGHAVGKAMKDNVKILGSKRLGRMVFNLYIRKLKANLVPKSTLDKFDLNNPYDVDALRTTEGAKWQT